MKFVIPFIILTIGPVANAAEVDWAVVDHANIDTLVVCKWESETKFQPVMTLQGNIAKVAYDDMKQCRQVIDDKMLLLEPGPVVLIVEKKQVIRFACQFNLNKGFVVFKVAEKDGNYSLGDRISERNRPFSGLGQKDLWEAIRLIWMQG